MSEIKKYLTLIAQNRFDLDSIFSKIPESILSDKLFFKYAIKLNGDTMKYAPLEISLNKELVLEAIVNSKNRDLQWINPIFQDDKDIILNVLEKNGYNLKFPINVLGKEYKELLLNALKIDFNARDFISNEYWNEIKNNRGLFIEFLSSNSLLLSEAKNEYKNDKEIVLVALKGKKYLGGIIEYASEKLRNDKGLVLFAIQNNDEGIFYKGKSKLVNDEDIILEGIKYISIHIFKSFVSDDLKNNIKFVLKCFKINNKIFSILIEEASNVLTNHQFILDAINYIDLESSDIDIQIIFKSIISKYNNESIIILELLKKLATKERKPITQGEIFALFSKSLKENEDFFIELVKIDWEYLRYGSSEFKSNSKIISAALKNNGHAIYWASEDSQNDKNLILEAIQNGAGTSIIPNELATKENILLAIRENLLLVEKNTIYIRDHFKRISLHMINDVLRDDEEFILEVIKLDGETIAYASSRILENDVIVLEAIKNTTTFMLYHQLFRKYNTDKDLVIELIKNSHSQNFLKYLSLDLRDDKDIVYSAICKSGYELEYASDRLKSDEEIVLKALEKDSSAIIHMSNDLINNKSFILKITQKFRFYSSDILKLMESFSKELLNDKELILHLLNTTSNIDVVKLAGHKIKNDLDIHVAKLKRQYT